MKHEVHRVFRTLLLVPLLMLGSACVTPGKQQLADALAEFRNKPSGAGRTNLSASKPADGEKRAETRTGKCTKDKQTGPSGAQDTTYKNSLASDADAKREKVAQKPITPDFTTQPADVQKMLVRSDPAACSATSDASEAEILTTYARLAMLYVETYAASKLEHDCEFNEKLAEFRPLLRELSRNTTWLPHSAEQLIGEQLFQYNGFTPYKPPKLRKRQVALVQDVLTPMFDSMKKFAKDELKSPLEFELRLINQPSETVLSVLAGGLVIVPSGLFNVLENEPEAEQVLAFMLSHEFSHALRRHRTKHVQMSLVDAITVAKQFRSMAKSTKEGYGAFKSVEAWRNGFSDAFQFTQNTVKSMVDQTCKSKDWFATMEQNQEFEADVCGALLLKKLGESRSRTYSAAQGYVAYLKNKATHGGEAVSSALALTKATDKKAAQAGVGKGETLTDTKVDSRGRGTGARNKLVATTNSKVGEAATSGSCGQKQTHPEPEQRLQNLRSYELSLTAGSPH